MLHWNPTTQRNLGLVLTVVSGVATTGWAWSSFKAADMVGSPYLWAAVLMTYFIGVSLIGASLPVNIDVDASGRIRKRLVLYFLAVAIVMGFLFLLIHLAIGGHPPAVGQKYAPWTLLGALLSYVPFYYFWSHQARFKGMGTLMVPMIYLLGQTFFPFAVIDYYNQVTQKVETIEGVGDLPSATSSFLYIKKLEVMPEYALEQTYHFDESDGQHKIIYMGLLPVNTDRTDTLFNVWLLFDDKIYFSKNLSEDVVQAKEQDFHLRHRNQMLSFQLDSVVFFDHSKLDNREVLRKHNYPLTEGAVVLIPVASSLNEYIGRGNSDNIFIICLLVLFFWIASAVDKYK